MTGLEIIPAGQTFERPGGREGGWMRLFGSREKGDEVTCPFDFVVTHGSVAESVCQELKGTHPQSTPMIFGSPHEAGILFERMSWPETSTEALLADATSFDIDGWLAARRAQNEADAIEFGDPVPMRGEWPKGDRAIHKLMVPNETLAPKKPKAQVIVGLLPTSDATATAAYLRFGGWNDCPPPPVHIAIARKWRASHGAVQVSNTYETIEFKLARPITDRQEALDMAMTQFCYCSDSVPDNLESSAASLLGSTVWQFWWD